jgi:peptide/nickel transport system substrate-binding protein
VGNMYGGLGAQARGPVPAGMWGHNADLAQPAQDLDRARELLAEAGHPDGGFDLTYTYSAGDLDEQQIGELWKADLAQLGVNLDVQGLTWEAQWDLAKNDPSTAQDIFVMYWWPDFVTPYSFLYAMFHSEDEPFFNLGYYNNPDYDTTIEQGNEVSASDREAASDLFGQAQQMLVDDAVGVFMLDLPDTHVIRDDVEGYVNNPAYPHVVFWYDLRRGQ